MFLSIFRLMEELQRGKMLTEQMDAKPSQRLETFKQLFELSEFFHRHKDYLQVNILAKTEDDLHTW